MNNIELETLTAVKAACRKYTSHDSATPDWEQRRYEISLAVLPAFVNNNAPDEAARSATSYADALIEELKK